MPSLGRLAIKFGADTQGFTRGIASVSARLKSFAARARALTMGVVGALRGVVNMMGSQINMANTSVVGAVKNWQGVLRSFALAIEAFIAGALPGFASFAKALGAVFGSGASQNLAFQLGVIVGNFLHVLGKLIEKILDLLGIDIGELPPPPPPPPEPTDPAKRAEVGAQSVQTAFGDMVVSPLETIERRIHQQVKLQMQQLDVLRKLALRGAPLI